LTIEAKGPQALEAVEALIVIFRKDFDEEQAQ
jgi:hypothetical protein